MGAPAQGHVGSHLIGVSTSPGRWEPMERTGQVGVSTMSLLIFLSRLRTPFGVVGATVDICGAVVAAIALASDRVELGSVRS